jgi:hypothetical protein
MAGRGNEKGVSDETNDDDYIVLYYWRESIRSRDRRRSIGGDGR